MASGEVKRLKTCLHLAGRNATRGICWKPPAGLTSTSVETARDWMQNPPVCLCE